MDGIALLLPHLRSSVTEVTAKAIMQSMFPWQWRLQTHEPHHRDGYQVQSQEDQGPENERTK
jgi:hypothetical protein